MIESTMKAQKTAAPRKQNETVTLGLMEWLRRTNLNDLTNSEMHSRDFNGSRAEYIYMRVRLLSIVFSILALLWIPIDIIIVPENALVSILTLRIAYSGLFLLLGLSTKGPQSLHCARLRLSIFVFIPCLFYVGSRLVFNSDTGIEGALVGYSFLPYLTVVLLAIFPLTLIEGISYASLVGITFLGSEVYFGGLLTGSTLGNVWLLTLLAGIAVWAQLAQLHMLLRLYREASRDALTGLVNRRVLNKWLQLEITRARQQQRPLSVLLFDLDFFKRVNDTYGHLTGDKVLQAFSRLLKRDLVNYNLISRYGGEEFLAVLPGLEESKAMAIADRIRRNCHTVNTKGPEGCLVNFTVSIGVTGLRDTDTTETLVSRVDKGLYSAKMKGRDIVVLAEEKEDSQT
ncbi:MAG TPA: GGDEF domain-containing protein [Gammaproteobacteria bacterium]|nr:GGDEF domain-containing protein [Gammaproteobacteria bacterium]